MNKERYSDPTADIAIANVMREEKRKRLETCAYEVHGDDRLVEKVNKEIARRESVDSI